ncbi:MAG: pyruvate carboxylase [Persicimonas sp.]
MPKKIENILCANRGEIAIRIFRACTELGIATTAIYSWEDRLAIHRYKADRAYLVGQKGEPVAAYLDGEAIIELALEKGVDAIHPGYGFLSENAEFAQKVIDAGLVWIGPPPQVMGELGDKVSAKKVARRAGVPVVPGTEDAVDTLDEAKAFADEVGFPLLVKAAHGGGGRGMRVVEDAGQLVEAFKGARSEAKAAFGSPEVFIERYIDKPRHIEVQLLGDQHGRRVHLFERDCSIQRRLQKIVELAPAPNLDEDVRQKLYDYALKLADTVGYSSAGTAEFLVEERDDQTHIYFIEVNTRIQVEHTVTEMVTGRDLIKAMIRVAEGHRLDDPEIDISGQDDVQLNGQAVQCRITTEDPENDFMPDTGRIITYRSAAGFGIRLDAGIGGTNTEVLPYYDSLLVKVSAHGRDLEDATNRLGRSLAEFRVRGVKTNMPFLQNVIRHPVFQRGETHTRFVDDTDELFVYPKRRDRGTKALRAIGDITVNGPPGTGNKLERPEPLIVPTPDEHPKASEISESPAYRVFREEGAEGLSSWIRDHQRLLITDTTFRDAHQSLLATRVRTRDLVDIAPMTARALPNIFSQEMWGGATFDVCMRFLKEDPWERLARMREKMPGTLFQMLLRGANAVGYTNYPDNVVRAFVEEAAGAGIDVFRIFDALNYLPNMELAIEEVNRQGKIAEASICYTGDVANPGEDKYTVDYYVDLAQKLEERGAHILNIKDMAGLLKPYSAKILIEALKDSVELPIHLHTHDTSGNGVAMYLMAAESGVDIIDCALSSMAGLTSQPSLNAVVTAMQGQPRQPDLPVRELQKLADHWELLREIYHPFESGLKSGTTDVYFHEIPGGQYSNLRPRAIQLGLGDQWERITRTYREVDQALGRLVKVTPTSKVVADMAMFLVRNDMSVQDVFDKHENGEDVDFPQSVIDFFMGRLGQPHGGFPEKLQQIVTRGAEPITDRAGDHLDDYDWQAKAGELAELLDREPTRREEISFALYPKVFSDLARSIDEFGQFRILDTVSFLYGMKPGEETMVDIEEGKTLVIKLLTIGPLEEDGTRTIYFELNGQPREVVVVDQSAELGAAVRPKADKTNPNQVGASMQGKVISLAVSVGDAVEKGQVLLSTEAMKMETNITAPTDGTVSHLEVAEGDQVDAGDLVAVIE